MAIVRLAARLFQVNSGQLKSILEFGLDAQNQGAWVPREPPKGASIAFEYIEFFDEHAENPRFGSYVSTGTFRYSVDFPGSLDFAFNLLFPLTSPPEAVTDDRSDRLFASARIQTSIQNLFHSDKSISVHRLVVGNGSVAAWTRGFEIRSKSLAQLANPTAWSTFRGVICGTDADTTLSAARYPLVARLFGGTENIVFRDIEQVSEQAAAKPRAIALQPFGSFGNSSLNAKRDIVGFAATVAIGRETLGRPGAATLSIDPEFTVITPELPKVTVTDDVEIDLLQDGRNLRLPANGGSEADRQRLFYLQVRSVDASVVAYLWNERIARPYNAALRTSDDVRDLSFVPLLEDARGGAFELLYDITYSPSEDPPGSVGRLAGWSMPVLVAFRPRHAKEIEFLADAVFPGLRTHDGKPVRRRVKVTVKRESLDRTFEWFDQPIPRPEDRPEINIQVSADEAPHDTAHPEEYKGEGGPIRIGALDLHVPSWAWERKENSQSHHFGRIDLSFRVTFDPLNPAAKTFAGAARDPKSQSNRHRLPRHGEAIPRIEVRVDRFDIADARPGSQDPVPDAGRAFAAVLEERANADPDAGNALQQKQTRREKQIAGDLTRDPPIVVVDAPISADPDATPLFVTGEEVTATDRNRRLNLVLHGASADPSLGLRTIVIDPAPVTVALVDLPSFGLDDNDRVETDGEIANWDLSELEGSRWEVARISEGFDLYFPPQATGEAAEKGRPWEPISPGPGQARTIDYRLGTLARLRLRSSYFKQRYAEAPWNLRRVLGYAGQRAPGAGLDTARFEFLYGLGARFTAPALRLAEVGSRIGAPRDPLPARPRGIARGGKLLDIPKQRRVEAEIYDDHRSTSASFAKAYGTRIGVFEAYREGTDEPFTVEDKVAFALRQGNGSGDADLQPEPFDPESKKGGLRGGALWGLESRNIFTEVIDTPESTRGQILTPAFSALGGSGFVRAFFAGGKTRLVSDTSLGRTHVYAIERIGRINCFWNICKHVILYQRTVLPSDQFQAEQADQHLGRPVLRKLNEYIELIEPDREYPEKAAAPKTRGFVEACRFRTWRIPVSGDWGHDVPDGWVIPLWRADADQDIYPKPDVRLQLAATGSDAAASVQARFKDPSQLLFFTSTLETEGDNPNLWAARGGIDFVNMPHPDPVGEPTLDPADPDGTAPDDMMRDPLVGNITFDIDAEGQVANLVTGRTTADPIGAVVETVTMARSAPTRADGGAAGRALTLRQELERIVFDLRRLEASFGDVLGVARGLLIQFIGSDPGQVKDKVLSEIERLRAVKGAVQAAAAGARLSIAEAVARARQALSGVTGDWAEKASDLKSHFEKLLGSELDARLRDIESTVVDIRLKLHALADNAPALSRRIDEMFFPVRATVRYAIGRVDDQIKRLAAALAECSARVKDVEDRVIDRRHEIDNAIDAIDADEFRQKAVALVERYCIEGLATLDALDKTIREKLPKKLKDRFKETHGDILSRLKDVRAVVVGGRDSAVATIAAAATNLDMAKATAKAATKTVHDAAKAITTAAASLLGGAKVAVDDANREASGFVNSTATLLDDRLKAIHEICSNPPADFADKVDKELSQLLADIGKSRNGVARTVNAVSAALSEVADDFYDGLQNASREIGGEIAKAETFADTTINSIAHSLMAAIDTTVDNLRAFAEGNAADLAEAAKALQIAANGVAKDLQDALPGPLIDSVRVLEEGYRRLSKAPTFQNPSDTLALIRAAGSSPILPDLKFNRDRIAYFFDDLRDSVKTSPVVALMNRLGDDLKALGIRVPTGELLDRLVPRGLERCDFPKLFPDLGLKCDGLFRNLRLPSSLNDNVKVTHGFDKASLTGWAKAEAKSNFPKRSEIFALGPLKLDVINGRFEAIADIAMGVDGKMRRSTKSDIAGDWELAFGGQTLVTLEDTHVRFEDGRGLDVDIDPSRIRFDRAIKFLSDLIKSYGEADSGFFLEMLEENGLPSGLAARIALPMPPLSFGAFSVWGLTLSGAFELHLVKGGGRERGDFAIGTALALGRKSEPFILRVWIFVGGGWLETRAKYFPTSGNLVSAVSIGLTAGLGLDFAFGPCRGYVFALFGVYAEFSSGAGTHLSVAVIFLVRGGIVILGRFNIGLYLLLEIIYRNDGSVTGRGTIEVTFKICWCLKITVRQGVTYHLVKGRAAAVQARGGLPHYLDSFA